MGFRVALATSSEYPDLHPDDRRLFASLERRGIHAEACLWSDERRDWRQFDAVVIRSCWDYFTRTDLFRAWMRRVESTGVRLFNPEAVVTANMDKRYLRELERQGAETVPTAWLDPEGAGRLPEFLAGLPWEDVVVKPAVSAGAFRTVRTTRTELIADPAPVREVLSASAALVQPYLKEIERQGEWSFLFFGDAFSHAVVKVPKAGDFRVQWRHGGTHRKVEPSAGLVRQVDAVRKLLDPSRLYARIDGVVVRGRFQLVEVEMIEPYLFLEEDPLAADRFADALLTRLTSRP